MQILFKIMLVLIIKKLNGCLVLIINKVKLEKIEKIKRIEKD